MNLGKLLNIQNNIASDVWPNGATLRCKTCGHQEHATAADCGKYLSKGWPKCCGRTMELVKLEPAQVQR